ncbi:MAG: (5-formylfuran-3-yl)methyl phosphate synthase [Planctomycetia bacterium]
MSSAPVEHRRDVRWWPASPRGGLLVSVRGAAEAVEALRGGATIIDVKEPLHGPLGAADPAVAAGVAAVVGRRAAWTLACGELADGTETIHDRVRRVIGLLPAGAVPPVAVKAGPAGTSAEHCRAALAALGRGLPPGVDPVAVAYADWPAASAPPPELLVAAAAAAGCRIFLLDTFDKSGPAILADPGAAARVADWVRLAQAAGMRVVLAGGLTAATVRAAVGCGPDLVGVRSAVCSGGRLGAVCGKRVAELVSLCGAADASAVGTSPGGGT